MNLTNWTWTFAFAFIILGVLGFIPAITAGGLLLGTFTLGTGLSLIFLASGILAAIIALISPETERLYFKVFGVLFLLTAVIGFVQGTSVLGLFGVNMASSVFTLIVAATALYLGFGVRREERMLTHRVHQTI